MNTTAQSEFGTLKKVFIKKATDAFIDDQKIGREWRELNFLSEPNLEVAINESAQFEKLLAQHGAEVQFFPTNKNLSLDSIYCRDATIATDRGMIICNMGKPARNGEPAACLHAYQQAGIAVLGEIKSPGTVEGGDVAWLDQHTLAVGRTYRTNAEGIRQLRELLAPGGVSVLEVALPHFRGPGDVFHLMSIFSPVDRDLAVVYSPLMPIPFREKLIHRGIQLVEVPEAEYDSMGCNVLAIGPRKVLMVKGNPKTKEQLIKADCHVLEYEGNEISVKGGGGPTCLTRPMQRVV